MSTAADHVIAALRSGHDDLASVVQGLRPDDLRRQSVDTEWDVSQVLSHLGSGAVIGLAALDAALAGEPNPGMELNQQVWARWDGMSPDERAAEVLPANAALVERYESLDDAAREQLRIDLGFLPEPIDVATAGRFRLNEFALHAWDVRASFDPTARVRPEAVAELLDQAAALLGWTGKGDRLGADGPVELAVSTTSPERTFGLRIAADGVGVGEVPVAPDGTLSLPAEAWLRLVSGRLRPEFGTDDVTVTGTVDLDGLRRVFPGY